MGKTTKKKLKTPKSLWWEGIIIWGVMFIQVFNKCSVSIYWGSGTTGGTREKSENKDKPAFVSLRLFKEHRWETWTKKYLIKSTLEWNRSGEHALLGPEDAAKSREVRRASGHVSLRIPGGLWQLHRPAVSGQSQHCLGSCGMKGLAAFPARVRGSCSWLNPHVGRTPHPSLEDEEKWGLCPGCARGTVTGAKLNSLEVTQEAGGTLAININLLKKRKKEIKRGADSAEGNPSAHSL